MGSSFFIIISVGLQHHHHQHHVGTSGSAVGNLRTTQSIVSNGGGGGSGNSLSGYMKSRPSGASVANTVTTTRDGRIVVGAAPVSTDVMTSPDDATNTAIASQQQQPAVSSSPPCSSTMHAASTDDVAVTVSSAPNARGESISPSSTVVKTAVTATTTAPIAKTGGRSSASGAATGDSMYSPTPIQRPQGTPSEIQIRYKQPGTD